MNFIRILASLMAVSILLLRADEEPVRKTFFLPKSPAAAAYVLGRLSNKELIEAPRSEFVFVALLQRKGLERKYRVEALEGLTKIRNTDLLTELLDSNRIVKWKWETGALDPLLVAHACASGNGTKSTPGVGADLWGDLRQTDTYFAVARGRLKLRETPSFPSELVYYERDEDAATRPSDYEKVGVTDRIASLTTWTQRRGTRCSSRS